jgi:hypothetical protein
MLRIDRRLVTRQTRGRTMGPFGQTSYRGDKLMSKGEDKKKETKKQPAKTMKEKRAEKKSKRADRSF